jgi:hypothetical protein
MGFVGYATAAAAVTINAAPKATHNAEPRTGKFMPFANRSGRSRDRDNHKKLHLRLSIPATFRNK